MKTSLFLPLELVIEQEAGNATALKQIVQAAERAGMDGCNLTDHPAPTAKWRQRGGHDAFDPFTALSFIAAATSRLRLHTHILVLPYRNPFLTAKCAATLDYLSEGRLILGIASGYLKAEYAALGVDFASRGAAMDEAIAVMKQVWSGEVVSHEGATFKADGILPTPIPVQKPHPPIWCGGNSERAIRRAAELCDGWSPFFAPPELATSARTESLVTLEELRAKIGVLRGHLDRVGRTGPFDICVGPPTRPKACTSSDAQRMIDESGAMAEMGITWQTSSLPQPSLSGFLESIQWFGEEVQPKLRTMGGTA